MTYEDGEPVAITRVDLYRVGATTNMLIIRSEVKAKLSTQADEVAIQAEGRTPQGIRDKDILNATREFGGARTVLQLAGPKPVIMRTEDGEGAPTGDPDATGANGGEILGPLGWVLLYLDIERRSGMFSPGGCAVFAPAILCPAPPQGSI